MERGLAEESEYTSSSSAIWFGTRDNGPRDPLSMGWEEGPQCCSVSPFGSGNIHREEEYVRTVAPAFSEAELAGRCDE